MIAPLALLLAACGTSTEAPPPPRDALSLAGPGPFAVLEVPDHSRPHAPTPPDRIPLRDWSEAKHGVSAPLPIRSRQLYFHRPAAGLKVVRANGTEIPHKQYRDGEDAFWTFGPKRVSVVGLDRVPGDDELFLVYPKAVERESSLNLLASGLDAADFVRTTAQFDVTSRAGLLLPAPAHAAWDVTLPVDAHLRFDLAMVDPEIADGPPSDGARVEVTVQTEKGGEEASVWSSGVKNARFRPIDVDLSKWSGQHVRLHVRTHPREDARFDYVFLAEPAVVRAVENPPRVVMVFIDTLRADHLGTYGYERPTSPNLDALGAEGVVFEQARSVAPWTLPSARTMMTGAFPEHFFDSPTLPGRLREEGFATAFLAGNLYLSANFGLHRDWGTHRAELLPQATDQIDRALSFLEDNAGRPSLLLLHLMDVHLPYKEPPRYRTRFAGQHPEKLRPRFGRNDVLRHGNDKKVRSYVVDRYDNNIAYVDDQLTRLWEVLDPDDIVIVLADHGEEFWEHGGYEHGHALWDEVLRVPMILRAPGVEPGRVSQPVSMLDVVPTVLDLLDLPHDDLPGTSLAAIADDPSVVADRPLSFGRPLYGREMWGVVDGPMKYMADADTERVFDLSKDPAEKRDLASPETIAPLRAALAEAEGREVVRAVRIRALTADSVPDGDFTLRVEVPGGVRSAWVGEDPRRTSSATLTIDGDVVDVAWHPPFRQGRDVWIVPEGDLDTVLPKMDMSASYGELQADIAVSPNRPAKLAGSIGPVGREPLGDRGVALEVGVTPMREPGAAALDGVDDETLEALRAMGYVVGEEEE